MFSYKESKIKLNMISYHENGEYIPLELGSAMIEFDMLEQKFCSVRWNDLQALFQVFCSLCICDDSYLYLDFHLFLSNFHYYTIYLQSDLYCLIEEFWNRSKTEIQMQEISLM